MNASTSPKPLKFRYKLRVKQAAGRWTVLGNCQDLRTLEKVAIESAKLYGWPYTIEDTETGRVVRSS